MSKPVNQCETNSGKSIGFILFLVAGVLLVYWQVWGFGFVSYDDGDYVYANEVVKRGLTWDGFKWAFTSGYASNWHPVTWLSHMLDCQVYALKAGGHHFTNVMLHAVNSVLLFCLLRRLTKAFWRSAIVAMFFAIHPLHVESVAWVAERKDVLSAFFGFLALIFYSKHAAARKLTSAGRSRTSIWYSGALITFALGLMSKPMLVTWPFVFLLIDFWPLERIVGAKRKEVFGLILEKLPFLLLAIASSFITFLVQSGKTVQTLANFSIIDRLSNVCVSYVTYLVKFFVPIKLAFFYPLLRAPEVWKSLSAFGILAALTFFAVRNARRIPSLMFGWLWFLGTLVPVIGLVQVGEQSHADRYTYLPSVGFFIAIVWLAHFWFVRWKVISLSISILSGAALVALGVVTFRQVSYWKNDRAMLERAIAVTDKNYVAYHNLGVLIADEGKLADSQGKKDEALAKSEKAIEYYQRAIAIRPNYARAYNNLGSALTIQGKLDEAVSAYEKSLSLREDAQTHHNLALALARQKRYEETIFHCRKALEINAAYKPAHYDLAVALSLTGKLDEAVNEFKRAVEVDPHDAYAHFQYANTLLRLDRSREAVVELREAVKLNPDLVDALIRLAWILSTSSDADLRNGLDALRLAERANEITQQRHPQVLSVLSAAYAEVGQIDKAVMTSKSAIALAEQIGRKEYAQSLKAQLQVFESGRPFRSSP